MGIELKWGVVAFGQVSLALTVSNFVIVFVSAIGVVLFPLLRRTSRELLPGIYSSTRQLFVAACVSLLVLYFPVKAILACWLPDFAESMLYMSLVFPIFIYESRMALLTGTYLKTLRFERVILLVNVGAVLVSGALTVLTTSVLASLDLAVASILVVVVLRSIAAEVVLASALRVSVWRSQLIEFCAVGLFVASAWVLDAWIVLAVDVGIVAMVCLAARRDIGVAWGSFRALAGSN